MAVNSAQFTLGFNTNTNAARKELQDLQSTLKQISHMSIDLVDDDAIQNIKMASDAATELNQALSAATNVKTGKLDLSAFQQSLSRSGKNVQDLISQLTLAGKTGQTAFAQLARSITNAHMPLKESSRLLNDFAVTMKNTVKWQLSSNIVHGLQSGLDGAIRYAKDLNSSLTDIRIVTGASADEMARFANSANAAAKRLSTSTLDYTKASLIYYQQGDSDAEVAKKAELTIKAANASTESTTQEMSEYLTAVWNSYKAGSDELTHFVDVMASLGAKTATSMEEIAGAMQKVASVGNSVGVEFEQLSSIIATVSSVTRQSAETVGTSFKTILARIGDLKLGETLEDGVTLGQVSSQLDALGIHVLDVNGELRDMGGVIEEIGAKWQTMNRATQTALAQSLAGKRQYTQLVALFDNWDKYNQNIDYAEDSDGALQKMQDTYAESWEAASKRVKASMESIYSDVINDKVIITMTNALADMIEKVQSLVDAFGGFGNVLGTVGTILTKTMQPQITQGISKMITNMEIGSGVASKKFMADQSKLIGDMLNNTMLTEQDQTIIGYYDKLRQAQQKLMESGRTYSQEEIANIQSVINKIHEKIDANIQLIQLQKERSANTQQAGDALYESMVTNIAMDAEGGQEAWDALKFSEQQKLLAKAREDLFETAEGAQDSLSEADYLGLAQALDEAAIAFKDAETKAEGFGTELKTGKDIVKAFISANKMIGKNDAISRQLHSTAQSFKSNNLTIEEAVKQYKSILQNSDLGGELRAALVDNIEQALQTAKDNNTLDEFIADLEIKIQKAQETINKLTTAAQGVSEMADNAMAGSTTQQQREQTRQAAQSEGRGEAQTPIAPEDMRMDEDLQKATEAADNFAQSLSQVFSGIISTVTGISTMKGAIEGLVNGTSTFGESVIALGVGLTETISGIGDFISNASSLKTLYQTLNSNLSTYLVNLIFGTSAEGAHAAASLATAVAKHAEAAGWNAATKAILTFMASNPLGWILGIVAGIIALTTAISGLIEAEKQEQKLAAETSRAQLDDIQERQAALKEEDDAVKEVIGKYEQLHQKYMENGGDKTEASDEYKTATDTVLEALGLEELKIMAVRGEYEQLAKIIDYANQKRIKQMELIASTDLANARSFNSTWFNTQDADREDKGKFGETEFLQSSYWNPLGENPDYNTRLPQDKWGTREDVYRFIGLADKFQGTAIHKGGTTGVWNNEKDMIKQFADWGFFVGNSGFHIGNDVSDFEIAQEDLLSTYNAMRAFEAELKESGDGRYGALTANEQWTYLMDMMETLVAPEIASALNLASANAQKKLNTQVSYEDWNAAQGGGKTKEQYLQMVEDSVLKEFTDLGLSEEQADSAVSTIMQSWVDGLSLDTGLADAYTDKKAKEAVEALYEGDRWAEERVKQNLAQSEHSQAQSDLETLRALQIAQMADPNSLETHELAEKASGLIQEGETLEQAISRLTGVEEQRRKDLNRTNVDTGIKVREDLVSIMQGFNPEYQYDNNKTGAYHGGNLYNVDMEDDTRLITELSDSIETQLNDWKTVTFDKNGQAEDRNAYMEASDNFIATWGVKAFMEIEDALIGKDGLGEATDQEFMEHMIAYATERQTEVDSALSLLTASHFLEEPEEKRSFTSEDGKIVIEDVDKILSAFASLATLDKQSDIWGLSNEAFVQFRDSLGEAYKDMTKEDFAKMTDTEWDQMLGAANNTLIPLMYALKDAALIDSEQIQALIEASVNTANKAHEAAAAAWEKIISLTRDQTDEEFKLNEQQEANTTAAKYFDEGRHYNELDAWTKHWLEEQYGEAAKIAGQTMEEYIYGQGGGEFLRAQNAGLAMQQGQIYQDQFDLASSITSASLAQGAYQADDNVYRIKIDDIEFASDAQKEAFLGSQGVNLESEDGVQYINIAPETIDQMRTIAQEASAKISESSSIEYESVQSSLDLDQSRQEAITGILDAKTMQEMASAANELRAAYKGADSETQQWVEDLIAAREAGEDGLEANRKLTSQHIRGAKDLAKMTKAQRNQYKEMLRANNVTVDGYKDLKEYFKVVDKTGAAIDELQENLGDFSMDDYTDALADGVASTEDTAQMVENVLPESMRSATDEIMAISDTVANGGTIFDALSGWLQDDGTFTQSINDVLNTMGLGAEQIAAMQASIQEQVEANGSIGAVDWLQVFADANVDPTQFDSIITALNSAMAQIQSLLAANGIELSPPWTPVPTLGSMGVGRGKGGGGSGGKTPGGKGGGGGKDKQKTKEDMLRAEDEIERYHKQDEVLDRVSEKLEAIDKLKDRTYGKKHLAQLDAETKALKEQLAAQADLYNEANKWRASDQKELMSLGVGVEFDADGNISNYEEVMQALIEKQNANIERYNNSDQDEGDKLRLEADEQWYEDAVQAIEDYEEALKKGNEALIEMEEIRNQISELELEKITYKLEIETDLNENDLELLEYYTDKWEDDLDKQAGRFMKVTDSITVYQDNLTALNNALNELNEQHRNGTINEADYAEGMQDIRDEIMENLENLEDAGDQLKEIYSDALELAREEIEKTTDAMQHSSDVMESYISIMGLMGKANDFEQLQAFYDAQYTYGIQQIGVLKSTYDTLIEARAEYDAKIEAGQKLSEVEQANYDALQEKIRETEEEMLDATESTLEAIKAGYENTVNAMSKDLEEFMVGAGNSIAGLADQYAYFQEKQDRYVSTAKELFEVSKLNRDIENSLADATTDASKEALKALQEKINKQSELNELTEYDIQMNQLEYQLLLARIQLEEASNSKDTVRLTRDENGNYAYQYTADQDKVNEALQQYEDVLQQINELSVERTGEIEQQMIDAMQNNLAKFNEIMTDETLSTEERNQKIADLNTQFSETMLYLQEQATVAGENLTWNQEMIAEHFGVALSDITASTAGNVNDSVQAMIDRADEFAAKMNAVLTGDGEGSVHGVWDTYKNKLKEVSDASGLNYESMTNKVSDFTHANDLAAGKANEVLDTLRDTLAPLTALTAAWGVHANMIESMVEYYEALADAMNDAMRDSANTGAAPVSAGGTPASTGFEDKGYGPYEVTMPDGTKVTHNATGPWSALAMAGVPYADVAKVNVIPKFYRGGLVDFTGLAQLDGTQTDPELVLNADDTRNMLETVRVVRQLDANTLSLLVSSLETSVNSMMAFMGSSYHAFGVPGMQAQTLDQNVQITAEFPNVTEHNEIEEAFNSLVNRAAQFAKQK